MRPTIRVAAIFAIVSTTCLLSGPPALAQLNWTQVPGYIDVQGRMTSIETLIVEALAEGRLSQAQAQRFKTALGEIKEQETKVRAGGRLSMFERVRIVMELDKLNTDIQNSFTARKIATTDVAGREAAIDRLIQESLLSGRLTSLEAMRFKKALADIRMKEQSLRGTGALSSNDLLALSIDMDKLTGAIEQSLTTRVVSDPGLDARKIELKRRIDELSMSGQIGAPQAELLNQELNRIVTRENTFKASGNVLSNEEKLALSLDLERLKGQLDRFQPVTVPTTVKSIDEQRAGISKSINDAKLAGKLTMQDYEDLSREFSRIEAMEAMFRADNKLSESELVTLTRDLDSLNKRVTEAASKVQVPDLNQRKAALRKRITDAQSAGRIKPDSLATDYLQELDRIEAKEQFYRADGSLNDTENMVLSHDVDALSSKVESSISALPNVAEQKNQIEKRLNDALASGRLEPLKAEEIRQELQRIAYLDSTFRGNDGLLDEREVVALNKEYSNLQARLDKQMPPLPDIDAIKASIESKLNQGQSDGAIDPSSAANLKRELDRIASVEASFRASDETLADWEVMALKRDLDRLQSDLERVYKAPSTRVDLTAASADTRGHWAQDYIAILQQRGTIGGFPDGTFKPDQGITRSQFAAIAVKALGLPAGGREVDFRDLPKAHWAYKAICSASDAGLVGGFPDGSFRPEDKLTRAQALVILAKALNKGTPDTAALDRYKDGTTVAAWAAPSVAKAASAGIIVNHPDPYSIRPSDLATRAEVAALTYQTMSNLGQKLPPLRIGLEASAD